MLRNHLPVTFFGRVSIPPVNDGNEVNCRQNIRKNTLSLTHTYATLLRENISYLIINDFLRRMEMRY